MPTSQGTGGRQTGNSTKDASYETNEGFTAAFDTHNNNIEIAKTTKQDEMAVKTTVVSVLGNGAGLADKPRRSNSAWFQALCVIVGVVAFSLLIAFIAVLLLYIQELDDSKSSGLFNKICLKDDCISRSAGESCIALFIYLIIYWRLNNVVLSSLLYLVIDHNQGYKPI